VTEIINFLKRQIYRVDSKNITNGNWNAIRQTKPFDVAFLKGENLLYPNGKGIVHRSPPIEESEEKRILLRIDER